MTKFKVCDTLGHCWNGYVKPNKKGRCIKKSTIQKAGNLYKWIIKDNSLLYKQVMIGGSRPIRNNKNEFIFKEFPNFKPNLSPKEIFQLGSFGGTYWRPIYSSITNKNYKNIHLQSNYPDDWWYSNPKFDNKNFLTNSWDNYDVTINRYGVKVGQTLEAWEEKNWITKFHPYGWVQWYCDFFIGKRSIDDKRQIKRWLGLASERGRFRKWLITIILKKKSKWDDETISPKIRQTLQHWAYQLTKLDFKKEVTNRV